MLAYFLVDDYDYALIEVSREEWVENGSAAWHEVAGTSFVHCRARYDLTAGANTIGEKTDGNYAILLRDDKGHCLAEWRYRDPDALLDAYRALRYSRGQDRLVDHFYLLEHP